jgi:hypothetical protein
MIPMLRLKPLPRQLLRLSNRVVLRNPNPNPSLRPTLSWAPPRWLQWNPDPGSPGGVAAGEAAEDLVNDLRRLRLLSHLKRSRIRLGRRLRLRRQ